MRYLKNSEVISTYGVSDKTVRNWIQAAKNNELELKLVQYNEKNYIADTAGNNRILTDLSENAIKYRNTRSRKTIEPSTEFFKIYNSIQIRDIIRCLDTYREIPSSYKYFKDGATYWNQYLNELYSSGSTNLLSNTDETLMASLGHILGHISNYDHVNLINLCVGNGNTTEGFVKQLSNTGKLKKIILIDISPDMLNIASANYKKWTKEKITVENEIRDLRYQRFNDLIMNDSYETDAAKTINIILFVAGPIVNFINPDQVLHTIHESIGSNDLLVTTLKRDTQKTRNFFDFNIREDSKIASTHENYVLNLLNVEPSLYEPEQIYIDETHTRTSRAVLKYDIDLNFRLDKYKKTISFKRGDRITLWRSHHHSDQQIRDRFENTGFKTIYMASSIDGELNLLIDKIAQ